MGTIMTQEQEVQIRLLTEAGISTIAAKRAVLGSKSSSPEAARVRAIEKYPAFKEELEGYIELDTHGAFTKVKCGTCGTVNRVYTSDLQWGVLSKHCKTGECRKVAKAIRAKEMDAEVSAAMALLLK